MGYQATSEIGGYSKIKHGIQRRLVQKEKPDAVIIATGASPARPPIKGIEGTNVLTAEEVLKGKALPKQKVVIAGGGMVGCETATYLASMGRQVTIVEMLPMIAVDEEYTRRFMLLKMMEEKKSEVVTEAEIVEINAKGVRVRRNGSSYEITADTVVLAMGMTSNDALAKSLGKQANVKVVGDALTPRNALEAIREGFLAGASIS